ncbi:MAG: HAD family hydrolase [Kiloniellales bacterium]
MTDLVIFDLDGVLIDSELLAARALAEELADHGHEITIEAVIERFVGVSGAVLLADLARERGSPLPDDFTERARARMQALYRRELQPVAGAAGALAALTLPRCVASNSPVDYIERTLDITGLAGHFAPEARFSAEMVANPKPAPDVFLHAAETMGAAPARCLVIEDSVAGVTAARAAGMTVLGFAGAGHIADPPAHGARLREAGAQHLLDDFAALPDLIEEAAR